MDDFNSEQIIELARHHGVLLRDMEVDKIMDLIGGYPVLLHSLFKRSIVDGTGVDELLAQAEADQGIFQEHLYWLTTWLDRGGLLETVCQILRKPTTRIDWESYSRLSQIGVLRSERGPEHPAHYLRYRLYQVYFRRVCSGKLINSSSKSWSKKSRS